MKQIFNFFYAIWKSILEFFSKWFYTAEEESLSVKLNIEFPTELSRTEFLTLVGENQVRWHHEVEGFLHTMKNLDVNIQEFKLKGIYTGLKIDEEKDLQQDFLGLLDQLKGEQLDLIKNALKEEKIMEDDDLRDEEIITEEEAGDPESPLHF